MRLKILFFISVLLVLTAGCINKKIPNVDELNTTYGSKDLLQIRTDNDDGNWVEWTIDDDERAAVKYTIHDRGYSEYSIGNLSIGTHTVKASTDGDSVSWTVHVQKVKEEYEEQKEETINKKQQYGYQSWDEQNRIANKKKMNSTPVI